MKTIEVTHSYEELRGIVIDILLKKEHITFGPKEYQYLVHGVGEVLIRKGAKHTDNPMTQGGGLWGVNYVKMDSRDIELVRDIFWDLFRQGIITLGLNENSDHWPFFRLSHHGEQTLLKQSPYRFHDADSYLRLVRAEAVDIHADTITYLEEGVATYYSDCLLSTCIMIGVAAEIEFLELVKVAAAILQNLVLSMANDSFSAKSKTFSKFLPLFRKNFAIQQERTWITI